MLRASQLKRVQKPRRREFRKLRPRIKIPGSIAWCAVVGTFTIKSLVLIA